MKFEIKNRLSGSVIFSLETDSLKLCVQAAVKNGADLSGAHLSGADLSGADLSGAYLRGAHLSGADLSGAKILTPSSAETIVQSVLQMGPMGSRSDYLVAFFTEAGAFVKAGCFFGTVAAFRAAVLEEHGTNQHAQEYALAADLIGLRAKLTADAVKAAA